MFVILLWSAFISVEEILTKIHHLQFKTMSTTKWKNSSPKIPSRYVYLNDKVLSLVISAGYEGGDFKGKKRVIFLDNLFKFKKLINTIIKETSKSSPIGI